MSTTRQIAERIIFALEAFDIGLYIKNPTEQNTQDLEWIRKRFDALVRKEGIDRADFFAKRGFIEKLIEEAGKG